MPPHILAEYKAPPGSGGAPHYYLPPKFEEAIKAPDMYCKDTEFGPIVLKPSHYFAPIFRVR